MIPTVQSGRDDVKYHAHVLTIRTPLTSEQKQDLKQDQPAIQPTNRGLEMDVAWLELTTPQAICFISQYPLHILFADVLRFAHLRYCSKARLNDFLNHVFLTPTISLGQQVRIRISSLEDDVYFIHDSCSVINERLPFPDSFSNILTATISKKQCLDALLLDKPVALISNSVTLLSFCTRELQSLLNDGVVYPILHHSELHSIIAKEQGKYIIPVQRQMSHVLSMAEIHIIDLDGDTSKQRSSSILSKWFLSRSKLPEKHQSMSAKSFSWLDRHLFEFKNKIFRNIGTIEVLRPVSLDGVSHGDLAFDTLEVPNKGWTKAEIIEEVQSTKRQAPTTPLAKRRSMLFGRKIRVSSTSSKDRLNSRLQEPAETCIITTPLPKLEEYQIGPVINGNSAEESHDTTAVDQPYEIGLDEEKKWQDVRIRMERSRSNVEVIEQRKRNRRIGRVLEDEIEEMSSYDDDHSRKWYF